MKMLNEEEKRRQRSYNMSRIRSKDTKPEITARHWLFMHGYHYRKNVRRLPGSPDIVLRKYSVCIFIHGCFWHGHEHERMPKSHAKFWHDKIERNKQRDAKDKQLLLSMGWNVITVWECQLKPKTLERTMHEVEYWINRSLLMKAEGRLNKQIELNAESLSRPVLPYQEHQDELDMAAEKTPDGYKQ